MTEKHSQFGPEIRSRLDGHLDAVEAALSGAGVPREERRQIADDLQSQILEMVSARSMGDPGLPDLEAILAELDPPEAYADGVPDSPQASTLREPEPPRFSRTAIVGALWAPLFFVAFFLATYATWVESGAPQPGPEWWQISLAWILLPLGLFAPFGTTILGFISISQIRHSSGRLCGLGLALFDALLYPILAFDSVIFVVYILVMRSYSRPLISGFPEMSAAWEGPFMTKVVWLGVLTILMIDLWIIHWAWRTASKQRFWGCVPRAG